MIFADLKNILKDYQPYIHSFADLNTSIYGIVPFKKRKDYHLESNILYVLKHEDISNLFSMTPPPQAKFNP